MSLPPMMDTAVKLVFVTFFISAGGSLDRSSSDLQQRLQDLDTFIQNLMTCESRPVVGLTVSVVKDGQTIFAKGFGQRDLQTGQAVDNRTLFGVGSISKSFTSALLASILGEREDVSWDTVLTDILGPSFRFRDQFRTEEATLRDLLAHKMGLESLGLALDVGQDIDRAELARQIRYYRQVYPFRTRWHYNNFMYTLAGHVAEKLTGKPYETLLRERLLQPLDMEDTVYLADTLEEDGFLNFAQTYKTHNQTGPFVPYSPEERRGRGVQRLGHGPVHEVPPQRGEGRGRPRGGAGGHATSDPRRGLHHAPVQREGRTRLAGGGGHAARVRTGVDEWLLQRP
ncbi:Hypp3108 [Branchiostoma lanceolatum]|uniref:Hypp3108 protein n=1 Tax=Branchiostoma lanceolatum TaxID=7740 RepID=A0A8J9ZZY3_BRALA|nr:Hypp3108 [Branchiostoma lanceolatum]